MAIAKIPRAAVANDHEPGDQTVEIYSLSVLIPETKMSGAALPLRALVDNSSSGCSGNPWHSLWLCHSSLCLFSVILCLLFLMKTLAIGVKANLHNPG